MLNYTIFERVGLNSHSTSWPAGTWPGLYRIQMCNGTVEELCINYWDVLHTMFLKHDLTPLQNVFTIPARSFIFQEYYDTTIYYWQVEKEKKRKIREKIVVVDTL